MAPVLTRVVDPAFYAPPLLERVAREGGYGATVSVRAAADGVHVTLGAPLDPPPATARTADAALRERLYAFLNEALAASLREYGRRAGWPLLDLPRPPAPARRRAPAADAMPEVPAGAPEGVPSEPAESGGWA